MEPNKPCDPAVDGKSLNAGGSCIADCKGGSGTVNTPGFHDDGSGKCIGAESLAATIAVLLSIAIFASI